MEAKIKDNKYREELKRKRTQTLIGVWDYLVDIKELDNVTYRLSIPLVNEIVEQYLTDVHILKYRYKIEKEIQLHKIAGLLTSLICRYRPILFLKDEYECKTELYINEYFAVVHGLCICSEHDHVDSFGKLTDKVWFKEWINDFLYLLHNRNHTPESLIFVYQTFCTFIHPFNFNKKEVMNDLTSP